MEKAVVTGGGGFVGKAVVRMLLERGISVTVVGRNRYPDVEAMGAKSACGDIRHASFLDAVFQGHDTVFHVAAKAGIWGDFAEYYAVNVQGTENVLAACRKNGIRSLVYTSTPSVVFNRADIHGIDEKAQYAREFLCHYAETKVMAEKLVLAASSGSLLTTAIRPHLVWGPGDTNLIPRLLARGRAGKLTQVGEGTNLVDISYIDNVAESHLLAADNLERSGSAAGRPYFISQGEPVNLWKWINGLFVRLGIPRVEKKISFGKAYLLGALCEKIYGLLAIRREPPMTRFLAEQLAKSHWFSIANAEKDLGYRARISTAEGMDRLVCWLRERT
ncbi:MAG: 3-beta hydroxysteroid dehydrogenase [Desulfobulbaceae bacterium DB1]|nr:MAG: 3-beta hydroxysteroid dehydrogenase [Desulfobulbaceae bacterium DB1]